MVIREYEGRTERDAIKKASEDLGVDIEDLKVEVISEKSRFFSFGNVVKIRVYLEDIDERIRKKTESFLKKLFEILGIEASINTFEEMDKLYVEVVSDDAGIIIGKRGKTLESLQLLTNIIVNKDNQEKWKKVILDIENYRGRRESSLQELAMKVARKVKKTRKPQLLEPMNPFERRIIHMALQRDPYIDTKSEGDGNLKRVKVYMKRKKSRNKNRKK